MAYAFPDLTVPRNTKDIEEWGVNILEAIESYYSAYYDRFRRKDFENYNIFVGQYDKQQFAYVTDTWGDTNPARFVSYKILKTFVDLLVGEFLAQPFDFSTVAVNSDAVARRFEKKIGLVTEALLRPYRKKIEQISGIQVDPGKYNIAIPEDVDMFIRKNFRENTEDVIYNGLRYLMKKYDFQDTFKRMLYDLLITGKEFVAVDIVGDDPILRRVDPRNLIYDLDIDVEDLSRAEWVSEQRLMTVSEIIHEYREWLHPSDIKELEDLRQTSQNAMADSYGEGAFRWYRYTNNYLTHIRVVRAVWRAHKEVKVKVSPNKYDASRPFIKVLPDNYKPRKGEQIEYREVTEVWECTRIGYDIYTKIRPIPFQSRREDLGYAFSPLPYFGALQYNINGQTVSLVDMLKNTAILYDIAMYNIELIMARSAGKAVVYDTSQLPEGMKLEDVMYQAKNHGFVFINSQQEGMSRFNQFQQIDFTMSNALTQLINLKMMLLQTMREVTGINESRMGMAQTSQTIGLTEYKLAQSSAVTRMMFHLHNKTIEAALTAVSDYLKYAWAGRKQFVFPLGETGVRFIELLADEDLPNNDYAIFIENNYKDAKNKKMIEQLASAALQSGKIDFLDIVKIINADTAKEAEKILEKAMEETRKMQQMMQQQQLQAQQQQAQQQAQLEQAKLQIQREGNMAKVQAAQVAAQGKVDAEKVEQQGKLQYEDHRYKRDIDRRAFEAGAVNEEEATPETAEEYIQNLIQSRQ